MPRPALVYAFVAALVLSLFWFIGHYGVGGWVIKLGSINKPTSEAFVLMATWALLGTSAAAALAASLMHSGGFAAALKRVGDQIRDRERQVVAVMAVAATMIALVVRYVWFEAAPFTDDEHAYLFSAELLSSGQLTTPSPPFKLFFDRNFIINDGQMYSQYFLGWPALLSLGVLVGVPGLVNPILFGLTVPAVYGVTRRLTGSTGWAFAAVILLASSPMGVFAAATMMSHTSCLMALSWCLWLAVVGRETVRWWWGPLLGLVFVLSFFIRPLTAVGLGLPILVWFAWGCLVEKGDKKAARLCLLGLGLVSIAGATAFFAVNDTLTGEPLRVAYKQYHIYARENGYRFSNWLSPIDRDTPNINLTEPSMGFWVTSMALLRVNAMLFGWPISFAFVVLARGRAARLPAVMLASFFASHFFARNVGVDTIGPLHFAEVLLPAVILSAIGGQCAERWFASNLGDTRAHLIPAAALVALIVTAATGYSAARALTASQVAHGVAQVYSAADRADLHHAVVFASRPAVPPCATKPVQHFVFWRPMSTVDADVVWANHITVALDRALMQRQFPDREGYLLAWDRSCRVHLVPLSSPTLEGYPANRIGGTENIDDLAAELDAPADPN